jgi:hypothetical protein
VTDFVELPVASGILIQDLQTTRALTDLAIGEFDAAIVFWRDPYAASSRCRSAPVGFSVAASPPPPPLPPPPPNHLVDLIAQLSELGGGDVTDCGTYLLKLPVFGWAPPRDELARSLVCGRAAVAAGRSFRIIAERQGIDSWIADGLLGTPRAIVHFEYDSMGRRLDTTPCPKAIVHPSLGIFACSGALPRP